MPTCWTPLSFWIYWDSVRRPDVEPTRLIRLTRQDGSTLDEWSGQPLPISATSPEMRIHSWSLVNQVSLMSHSLRVAMWDERQFGDHGVMRFAA